MLLAGLKQNTGMHYVVALLWHVTAALLLASLQLRPVRAWFISLQLRPHMNMTKSCPHSPPSRQSKEKPSGDPGQTS